MKPSPLIPILASALLGIGSSAVAQVNRNIESYVLFAFDELDFKGRDADVTRGFIRNGNVGVNKIDPTPTSGGNLLNMGGGGSSHPVIMSPGTQVVADSMNLGGSDVTVWDIYSNLPTAATLQANRNSGPTGFVAPVLLSIPSLGFTPNRASTNAAADVTINENLTLSLNPGTYRDVKPKDGSTLNLIGGVYDFRSMRAGKGVTINCTDATIILVDQDFTFNNDGFFGVGTNGGAKVYAGSYNVGSNDATIAFSRRTEAHGRFYAPNGNLNLGNHTDLYGSFWANRINSDWNVNIWAVPEPGALLGFATGLGLLVVSRRKAR